MSEKSGRQARTGWSFEIHSTANKSRNVRGWRLSELEARLAHHCSPRLAATEGRAPHSRAAKMHKPLNF